MLRVEKGSHLLQFQADLLSAGVGGATDRVGGVVARAVLFQTVGGRGGGQGGGKAVASVSSLSEKSRLRLSIQARGLGFGFGPRLVAERGMGGSGPPGTRFGRHLYGEMNSSIRRHLSCPVGAAAATAGGGGMDGAGGGGGGGGGGAAPRHQGRGRLCSGPSGDCSGELTSGERSSPQVQVDPSGWTLPQRLSARIGDLHSRQMHKQCAASSPHWPPPGLTCGHILTLAVWGPQNLEFGARPS